ncbi:MAG: 50S ribosomal protein L18 [Dehalococcoidia bacterium]|nr:50S ribosomal protein L18 [Dehalococcoidia bacterium]
MRQLRHLRVRKRVTGSSARPRLSVFRSLRQVAAQIIDDSRGHTLAAASSLEPALRQQLTGKSKLEAARQVGVLIAQRAKEQGLSRVVFDRGGYKYHGRVKAVAEAAREGGLEF